ncbi:MAG: hypothetical protein JSV22_09340 [Bacteroidales bacterium]|nr:MAG: hypothetical protein JSV22_09340 [Bacteroidales bacterium]
MKGVIYKILLMKGLTLLSLIFLLSLKTSGQNFEWKTGFHGFFDNREYFNEYTDPQTIFGSRLFTEAGFALNDYHRFKAGLNFLYEFGSKGDLIAPDITMYYNGQSKYINFFIGAFPRRDIIQHPLILLNDTLEYFRPNVEGMFLEFKTGWGYHNIWIDWTGRQTDTKRETFLIGGEGMISKGVFLYKHNFIIYHRASLAIPIPGDHIRDNGGLTASLGVNLSSIIPADSLIITSGVAVSYDRLRNVYDFNFPAGWLNNFRLSHKGVGINGLYYSGNNHILLYGEGFYKSKHYGRVDLFYESQNFHIVRGKLQFSFHFIPGEINTSQSFTIYLSLDGKRRINRGTN